MTKPTGYAGGMERMGLELELALAGQEALTRAQLAERAELSESRTGDILAELHEAGAVSYDGRPRQYRLVDVDKLYVAIERAWAIR